MKAGDQNFPAFEAGRRILATWPDQGGAVHIELSAGARRDELRRQMLLAVVQAVMLPRGKPIRQRTKKKTARAQTPAASALKTNFLPDADSKLL